MRFMEKAKDGGPDSPVEAYFLFEIKRVASIAILKFNTGSRENYHTHAFHALSWFLKGHMYEVKEGKLSLYKRSILPKITRRQDLHKVVALETSWCFTIRGPWINRWKERTPQGHYINLTHGRKVCIQ